MAQSLGLGCKIKTDLDVWKKCMVGDKNALLYLEKYNQKDVVLLEQIYLKSIYIGL